MRRIVPAAVALAAVAIVAGLVLDRGDPVPRTNGGWVPLLAPRSEAPTTTVPAHPIEDPSAPPQAQLLPPATAPARAYPL